MLSSDQQGCRAADTRKPIDPCYHLSLVGNANESLEWSGSDEPAVITAIDELNGETAIDELNGERHVIIADASCDGAWIAMPDNKGRPLPSWR